MKNPHAVALGRKGGKAGTGKAKARSSDQARKASSARWHLPHILKAKYFVSHFPLKLESAEWQVRWPIPDAGRKSKTYNPDFFCKEWNCYLEVVTSMANVSEQCSAWEEAIKLGYPLRVFWWAGEEITNRVKLGNCSVNDLCKVQPDVYDLYAKKGGRPKVKKRKPL